LWTIPTKKGPTKTKKQSKAKKKTMNTKFICVNWIAFKVTKVVEHEEILGWAYRSFKQCQPVGFASNGCNNNVGKKSLNDGFFFRTWETTLCASTNGEQSLKDSRSLIIYEL
jgi:hypothetical protein